MTQTIEQLTARIAELEEENARLKAREYEFSSVAVQNGREVDRLNIELAASHASAAVSVD